LVLAVCGTVFLALCPLAPARGGASGGPAEGAAWGGAERREAVEADSSAQGASEEAQPLFLDKPSYDELKEKAEDLAGRVAQDSTNYELQFELAGLYYDMGELLMSARHYEKAAELSPDSTKALVNLGVVLNEMGRSEEAIEKYERALAKNPKDTKALCNLGLAYYGTGEYAKAMRQYKTALEIAPESLEAHYNLGVAFADAQIYREAIAQWSKVIELSPESDAARAAKANIEVIRELIDLEKRPPE
jgi:superkiller protein 3